MHGNPLLVEPEELQGLQRVHRGRPGLPRFTAGVRRREAGAARPEPVGILEREEARAPAVVLHLGSRRRHVVRRRIREISQRLPANGGIGLDQPVDHAHRRRVIPAHGMSSFGGLATTKADGTGPAVALGNRRLATDVGA